MKPPPAKVLFSAWFQAQMDRQDLTGQLARAWNAQPYQKRKGRVNASRIGRQLNVELSVAEGIISAYSTETGRKP